MKVSKEKPVAKSTKATPAKKPKASPDSAEDHLFRVRRICCALPGTTEKLSHGAPTFFSKKGVYAMFASNVHGDGRIAVWIPAEPGAQATLMQAEPKKFYRPPYVGVKGWVGLEVNQVDDDELGFHLSDAHRLISSKKTGRK